jgi:hypothetical protein
MIAPTPPCGKSFGSKDLCQRPDHASVKEIIFSPDFSQRRAQAGDEIADS